MVGTDCSGIECLSQSLENMNISFTHRFSSEHDKTVQQIIKANLKPDILCGDLAKRSIAKVPKVDLYVTGFPCQPFSAAGKLQGFQDKKNRGTIVFHIMKYIRQKKPKIFILENVERITTLKEGEYLQIIMEELQSMPSYTIQSTVLNTQDHGLPQNTSRWYCVRILKQVQVDEFNSKISCSWYQ